MLPELKAFGDWANANQGVVAIGLFVIPIVSIGLNSLVKQVQMRRRVSPTTIAPSVEWVARLNALLQEDVRVQPLVVEPRIDIEGALDLSPEETARAHEIRGGLPANDAVAVLVREPIWDDSPVVLHVRTTDYASVCSRSELRARPIMLSANVVIGCMESRELILHRRSDGISRDYPLALHTFGGSYIPPGSGAILDDRLSLVRTACRELSEESGLVFGLDPMPPLVLGIERGIGFVHLALIGVNVSLESLNRAEANPHEGGISRVSWDSLRERLLRDNWVPAGKAQVLSWLALGAPLGSSRASFEGKSGQELFDDLVP